jgi:hypothetical protein
MRSSIPKLDVQPVNAWHAKRKAKTPEKRIDTRTQNKPDQQPAPPETHQGEVLTRNCQKRLNPVVYQESTTDRGNDFGFELA